MNVSHPKAVPVGRMGASDVIANAVTFFASGDASFVTGQRIEVDGGRFLAHSVVAHENAAETCVLD